MDGREERPVGERGRHLSGRDACGCALARDQWTNVMTSPGDDGERESEGLKC